MFIDLEECMVQMVRCVSVDVIAAGLFAHISWSATRLKDEPLQCWLLEPLWVLNRCTMLWDEAQIDRLMALARHSNIVSIALEAVLGYEVVLEGEVHSTALVAQFREESVELVLAFCFQIFSYFETRPSDFTESMMKHLLEDVALFEQLAKFACEYAIFQARPTAVAVSLVLWCCLVFSYGMHQYDVDQTLCVRLKLRLGTLRIRFKGEPILSHLWDVLDNVLHADVLADMLASPHYLFRLIAQDRLI